MKDVAAVWPSGRAATGITAIRRRLPLSVTQCQMLRRPRDECACVGAARESLWEALASVGMQTRVRNPPVPRIAVYRSLARLPEVMAHVSAREG